MATVQYERDLRSTQKATKRRKDSAVKWSYGVRSLPGVYQTPVAGRARPVLRGAFPPFLAQPDLDEQRYAHLLPSNSKDHDDDKDEAPVVQQHYRPATGPANTKRHRKTTVASKLPSSRVPPETDVDAACSEMDLLGSPRRATGHGTVLSIPVEASETAVAAARGILVAAPPDMAVMPAAPALSLDVFAKPNVRATEKLVKKEYEVLDTNGEALTGRKARQALRQETTIGAAAAPSAAPAAPLGDEDFELV